MNKLESLPPEIESMKSLTDLYLSANELLELPENIGIKVLLYFYTTFFYGLKCVLFLFNEMFSYKGAKDVKTFCIWKT